jgi:hypothetical protein
MLIGVDDGFEVAVVEANKNRRRNYSHPPLKSTA